MPQLTDDVILAAIAGFQQQKTKIDEQIGRLQGMLSGRRTTASLTAAGELGRRRRKVSAAARRRMSEAQKSRWARVRGETTRSSQSNAQAARPKRRLSEEGRKAIIAATKRRWRLQKAMAAKGQTGTTKTAQKRTSSARKAASSPALTAGAASV